MTVCELRGLIFVIAKRPWNFTAPLSDMVKLQQEMTNVLVPQLEAITPGSGCYLNEVNPLLFTPPNLSSQA